MASFLNRKGVGYFLKVIIGVALYIYLAAKGKISFDFFEYKYSSLLTCLFLLQAVMLVCGALRWHEIAARTYAVKVSLLTATYISWVGLFFANFMPATLGTDASRVFYVGRKTGVSKIDLIKVTVVERASAFLVVLLCSSLGLIFYLKSFSALSSVSCIAAVLFCLKVFPKKRLQAVLLKKDIRLPPFSIVLLSLLIFVLKAFSIFVIIYSVAGKGSLTDYYVCLASQLIEAFRILPANIGVGHILFDKSLGVIKDINGAQIYNIYFMVKVLFQMTGFIGWLFIKKE